jgi:hypothetical protein
MTRKQRKVQQRKDAATLTQAKNRADRADALTRNLHNRLYQMESRSAATIPVPSDLVVKLLRQAMVDTVRQIKPMVAEQMLAVSQHTDDFISSYEESMIIRSMGNLPEDSRSGWRPGTTTLPLSFQNSDGHI